ncbi:MAG: PHP domain-containing protein [Firmicutes bacterium]|nr:PHP domain-containing protein [Bacillota bacterium]
MSTSARADLHVHTTASDGALTPEGAVDLAGSLGLAAVALADHDTVAGIEPAVRRSRERGGPPEVIPALEVNTEWRGRDIHILGYFVEWEDERLARALARLRAARLARVERMLEKLAALGIRIPLDRVISLCEEGSVGRPHVARAMVEGGWVGSLREAFERYLGRGRPAFVERYRFSPVEAVRVVRAAGGVAVLAHPGQEATPALIRELVAAGLEGVEVRHPEHDERLERMYRAMARELGLVATGGSDCHGPGSAYGAALGSYTVEAGVVEELRLRKEGRTK